MTLIHAGDRIWTSVPQPDQRRAAVWQSDDGITLMLPWRVSEQAHDRGIEIDEWLIKRVIALRLARVPAAPLRSIRPLVLSFEESDIEKAAGTGHHPPYPFRDG